MGLAIGIEINRKAIVAALCALSFVVGGCREGSGPVQQNSGSGAIPIPEQPAQPGPGNGNNGSSGAAPSPTPVPTPAAGQPSLPSLPGFPGGTLPTTPPTTTPPGANGWGKTCGSIPGVMGKSMFGPQSAKYCVYSNSSKPKNTIWFFHGLGDNENTFDTAEQSSVSYAELLAGLPNDTQIVLISYGSSWLLTRYPGRTLEPVDSQVSVFETKIVPFIEGQFKMTRPYVAMGHSMGGFNTATLCSSLPTLWSKCVLLNAMLPSCDPFAGSGGFGFCHPGPSMVIDDHFTASGYATTQPTVLLNSVASMPKSFVTVCKNDQFGLFDGPQAWSTAARARGFDSVFYPVMSNCDHSLWPANEVIDFLD